MKKQLFFLATICGCVFLTLCTPYIAPPFTNVMKVSQIRHGMKVKQVVDLLGVEPYDIYHVQETNAMVASFNYRLKKRIIKLNTLNRDEYVRQTTNEDSQTAGDLYYEKDYKTAYVLFNNDGEVVSYVTSSGIDNSNRILIVNNTIRHINEKNINLLDPAISSQVIDLNKKEKRQRKEKRSIFSRIFGFMFPFHSRHND
jgi:hypothetical protein